MNSTLTNPTTRVLSKEKIESLTKSLEARVNLSGSETTEQTLDTINTLYNEHTLNYPEEAWIALRQKYTQPKGIEQNEDYQKLFTLAQRWKETGNSTTGTTLYELLGIKDKNAFRKYFTQEAIVAVSNKLGYKIDKEDTPEQIGSIEKLQMQNYIQQVLLYKEPVSEQIPTETLQKQTTNLNRLIHAKKIEGTPETTIDDIFPKQENVLHSYHPQAVLLAAVINNLKIIQYNDPILRGCYQANGIPVKPQPEVLKAIQQKPELVTQYK